MATESLTVVCAWCQRIVTVGSTRARVTHTICETCLDRTAQMRDDETDPTVFDPPPGYFGDAFKR